MLEVSAAEDMGELARQLASIVGQPTGDPMSAEWIVVATSGMQRWLSLELSRHLGTSGPDRSDGIAANLDLLFPNQLQRRILSAHHTDEIDPWELERVAWVVLQTLDEMTSGTGDALLGPLNRLAPGATAWGRSRRIADLFDRYLTHRPDMIRAWADGRDHDAVGRPLDPHARWQPHLWRRLRATIGTPSPPELLPSRIAALRDGACPEEVPERIALFGLGTIPGGAPFLDLLEALGTQRDVHLLLHQPSTQLARPVRATTSPGHRGPLRRADESTAEAAAHPLLRSWGRPSRETIVLLGDLLPPADATPDQALPGPTLLSRVQADVRANRTPLGDHPFDPTDGSVRIHSCHGTTRQVEVLRDQILHLLADDPSLSEDDVIVLCPALEEFVPSIESVFGPASDAGTDAEHGGTSPALRYRIADRSLRSSYPLLAAMGALLELLASRFSGDAVVDLANLAPVRQRFGFTDADLTTFSTWVDQTNTRWGIDGEHRSRWGIPSEHSDGTWQVGLDRMLIGVTTSDDPTALATGGVLPLSVEGSDVSLAGRVADLLARLAALADEVTEPRPIHQWIPVLLRAADGLLAVEPAMAWQRQRLVTLIEAIGRNAELHGAPNPVDLHLGDVRNLFGRHLQGAAGRSDFFRGGVTFCSLTPLRAIPHRVICLLGMDETSFSGGFVDGDDLSASDPFVGDRERRADQRQMLLDTVLAARDHLIVVRTGHSVVTNQPVPAAVVVAEWRDALAATVAPHQRESFLEWLTIVHPRQRFDERNFLPQGSPSPAAQRRGPWSFDRLARDGAEARATSTAKAPFLSAALDGGDDRVIAVADLRRFLLHPTRYFLQRVIELDLPRNPERRGGKLVAPSTGSNGIPRAAEGRDLLLDLGTLEELALRDRLLAHLRDGKEFDAFVRRERAAGSLPPGRLADAAVQALVDQVEPLVDGLEALGTLGKVADHRVIDLTLADGTRLVGSVRDDGAYRPGPIEVIVGSPKPHHRLGPWLDAVLLTAQDPATAWQAVLLSSEKAQAKALGFDLGDPEPQDRQRRALDALEVIVDLFRRGQREPLPLFPKLSWALHRGNDPRGAWNSSDRSRGDDADVHIQVAFSHASVDEITSLELRDDDPPGIGADRATRFADRLWSTVVGTAPGAKVALG